MFRTLQMASISGGVGEQPEVGGGGGQAGMRTSSSSGHGYNCQYGELGLSWPVGTWQAM